jgi:hypothetical protein
MLTEGRFFCGHFFIEYRSQRRYQKSSISLTKKRYFAVEIAGGASAGA